MTTLTCYEPFAHSGQFCVGKGVVKRFHDSRQLGLGARPWACFIVRGDEAACLFSTDLISWLYVRSCKVLVDAGH